MISYTTQNKTYALFQTSFPCRPMMPKKSRILNSGVKLNASEPYSEIVFTGGHSLGSNRLSQNELLSYSAFLLFLAFTYL